MPFTVMRWWVLTHDLGIHCAYHIPDHLEAASRIKAGEWPDKGHLSDNTRRMSLYPLENNMHIESETFWMALCPSKEGYMGLRTKDSAGVVLCTITSNDRLADFAIPAPTV